MEEIKPFNPLDKKNLGISVAEALLSQPLTALPPGQFKGAGVYAIYYTGDFSLYNELAKRKDVPIYVGKAVPAGARIGLTDSAGAAGFALYNRLSEHAESIRSVDNLRIEDFTCRFLVVDDIWIPLGESLIIQRFRPLWNVYIAGFGNHDPGKGRRNQKKSNWDLIHPGRSWAEKLVGENVPITELESRLKEQIESYIIGLDAENDRQNEN